MKPSIQTLGQILYSPSQYVIPVFQRNYRWDRPQWEKLWASLSEIQLPEKTGNHFMGFLVFVPGLAQPGQHTRFHLIDGQQRLTTCSLLLIALRNVAHRCDQGELEQEIQDYCLVHPLKKGEQRYRLLPKEHDQISYVDLVEGRAAPSGRMSDALSYFEQQLDAEVSEDPLALRRIFDVACQRLEFMCATLEAENAYNIFKSLNSTGVPLGPSDLIRNFVFMHVPPDDQDEFDRECWAPLEAGFAGSDGRLDEDRFSRFFRDVLMIDGRYVQPKNTFSTFESRHEATGFVPKALAQSLLASARHHAVISGQMADVSVDVTDALAQLNVLESSTTYPLLLALFHRRAKDQLDSTQLARSVRMLSGFILRRFVCGESSRGYGQMFVRSLANDDGDAVATLEHYLLERGWPSDDQFAEAFVVFPLYKRGYAREVLEALERARGHKEQGDLKSAQIEHVMPQTLRDEWKTALGNDAARIHPEWLHRPGNLTLSAYNQEVGNQPFSVKRKRFAESNVVLTRELGESVTWGEDDIRARGERLASEAVKIWPGPKQPYQASEATNAVNDYQAQRFAFWTGLAEYLTQAHPELPKVQPRKARRMRLSTGVSYISTVLRYKIQTGQLFIDVYFNKKKVIPVWQRLRDGPDAMNAAIDDTWLFDISPTGKWAWATVSYDGVPDDRSEWPTAYGWLGQKLSLLDEQVYPILRQELEDAGV